VFAVMFSLKKRWVAAEKVMVTVLLLLPGAKE
jgi:hypothetical protein